ncbi:LOW QUALITY PROTEIN: DNA-dependent protein kinase catalytic subunit [Bombina bombina]|uniref:LOW QUALITY PROTEIN: DNA-dependent protein kinase catalytic subunit n=1 Tax=Bombina bombina TaxID=8345 RepID=UPI00235AF341|nr:LOW QUALITY PROTEIN: DNA-dependent protein kinase catalytic subunit [Bombina bombina]
MLPATASSSRDNDGREESDALGPAETAGGILGSLHQLHGFLRSREPGLVCEAAHGVLRKVGEECVVASQGSSDLALKTSLIFSKEIGLLVFINKSINIDEFRDCREECLKFLCTFLEKIGLNVQPYAVDLKILCIAAYTKEKAAKCKVPALELLIKLLLLMKNSYTIEEFKVCDIFNKFYGELASKSKISDTVLEKIYELLGVLGEVQPGDMLNNSEKLFRAYLGELKTQMTSSTREPKFPVVAGCLKGLSALLVNFTKSVEEDAKTSKEIFDFTVKAINPQVDLKRYAVPSAGLQLLSLHASQFSTYLTDNYRSVFDILSKWSGHTNPDMKKLGFSALDSFLKQIAMLVTNDAEAHKSKLQFFMKQFYDIIRKMESNNKELSIAIRGYGLFAAPCKAVNANNVDLMYIELIQRCKQMYLTEADTEEDNVYQLPNFLQSIASVILHLDSIPEVYTPVLERLLVVQIDSFSQYSPKMQSSCYKSILKVFLSLAGKGPVLWSVISTVVHQGLIRVCSKPLAFTREGYNREGNESAPAGEVRSGKWKVPSYKDYVELFRSLLNCDQIKESIFSDETFSTVNPPLQSLNRLLYDELIKSVLKIVDKLDLSLQKQDASLEGDSDISSSLLIATSDPAANLYPTKPKDFTAFVNLVDFCSEILPNKHLEYFEPWVYVFGYEIVLQSTRLPLISGFYKLLSIVMKNANKLRYFGGASPKSFKKIQEDPEKFSCFALFSKFGKEVSAKMKQFKDELLASCLTFVLSLPHDIVMLDMKAYVPALQTAFKLGLSCPSLADAGLDALEDWSTHIPFHIMQPYYKDVLPSLDGYLTNFSSTDDLNTMEIARLSRASQKGFNKYLIRQIKRANILSVKEESSLEAVRSRVVRILGSLGGQINRSLVSAASAEEMIKNHVSWDTEKRLNFAVPFADLKPTIYLDTFLPHVTELALSASDRQTKVAACELLHSMVAFMLGKASQMPEGKTGPPPMYKLYKRTFPVLLQLACDVDQVTRQLYEPLVMGMIHWFTSNKKYESQDTVALLEAILDGIVDPVDSTLRDFSGQCIREFLKWSIKQTTPQQQEKSPVNTLSLFKRLYSLALHPNAFKRLGSALAFNSIYREFREETALVDNFVFEVLVVYMESLALSHADEKSLGTIQQCNDVINHLKRIIQKSASLNKKVARRIPRGFPQSKPICLLDVIFWLLKQCGRPQTECRHMAMQLVFEFVPLLPASSSLSTWLNDLIKKEGIAFLINMFEGAGSGDAKCSGILHIPTLHDLHEPFSLRAVVQWMDMLLAALDCYNTFIGMRAIKPHVLLDSAVQSSLLKASHFFIKQLSMEDIIAAQNCFTTGSKTQIFSPCEREEYNFNKCTIIVRVMEFVTMILDTCQQDFLKVLENDLLNDTMWNLTAATVCNPSSIGFNIADVQVMKNLPDVCILLMKAVLKSPYKKGLEVYFKKNLTMQSIEELCTVDLYNTDVRHDYIKLSSILSACKQLYKAELLHSVIQTQISGSHFNTGTRLLSVVYKGIAPGEERKSLPSLGISSKRLADQILQLSFSFGGQCEELVSLLLNSVVLSVPLSGTSQRNFINFSHGEYFYSLFSETINTELLNNLDKVVLQLLKSATENPKMVSCVLNGMLDQSFKQRTVRKQQGIKLVNAILQNWMRLESWWTEDSSPESKMAVLTLLAKVLQVDSSVSFDASHPAFGEVFNTYMSILKDQKLGLNLKSQAVLILPFFTNLTDEHLNKLKNALDEFVAFNIPIRADEFYKGTLKYNNYVDCMKKFLDALELSQSSMLLQLMAEILCRDSEHFMETLFQSTFKKLAQRSSFDKQLAFLDTVHSMFKSEDLLSNITRQSIVDRCLLTLMWNCSLDTLKQFLSQTITHIMDTIKSRFTKAPEASFDTQITKKLCYYKVLELLYSRLSKDDIYSKVSRINQAFIGSSNAEGNELTKTLIKSCYDAFTENMSGETQLLEKRRRYHCAAYNCAIAVVSCVFSECKFYQGFLFTEKKEKNLLIFENLIDLQRNYSFPIEVEVPLERKRKYFAIRKEAREAANVDSDEPQYLSSQSYMSDSSLSEEMSQFDFSTGVQSFSYSSQTMSHSHGRSKRMEHMPEAQLLDEMIEFEMDELNQHECMTAMTGLIKHMQRNEITPKVEEGVTPQDIPPWMKFLHEKLGNPSTPLNIRLFISKLIVNAEEVFRPYARFWIGPILQLVVSGNNGGKGIHYMVVETVVTLLSWSSIATPTGLAKDEILANRLLEFLMTHAFHEKRAVYRHNLEIIKTLLECWKECLSIPYRIIFNGFSGTDPNTKDNSVGIQLLGLILANNFSPYDPKCGIDNDRYFLALTHNLGFVRFKEVYIAAAEVLGLVLRYIAEKEKASDGAVFGYVVKELKRHQSTNKEDKFIMCLNKIVKNYPPFADRFMTVVLFLMPKLHGILKTQCLEIIMYRAEDIPDLFVELKNKDFKQVMNNRDDERQRVCLDIIYKMLSKLKPSELREFLPSVTSFSTNSFPVCRERMYSILMWIYDNYRDDESQTDSDSLEIFNVSKEVLLQGLVDENTELQLIIRNFWGAETRLPTGTVDRMLSILSSLYSPKIEKDYLSLATNLLLEMTSKSPDYVRHMFEHPLSECKFQEYMVDSNWRFRSTVLTPMFVETQASQSGHRSKTQGSVSVLEAVSGQLRATQQHYQFTPTQNIGGRSSFNWLTGSSIDTLADYTAETSSESLSSALLFTKKSEKLRRGLLKPVGPDFGKKRLGLPGDETDGKTKGIEERSEILRLRRRFLKDQEKLSLIYARKGVAEQKREKAIKVEQKMKQDAQVVLYRSYRHGDLPDIQIAYSNLIAPLQALAQRDPTLAKMLFSSLFSGILAEIDHHRIRNIAKNLLEQFNGFLNKTVSYFPPFIACIQGICYEHTELLDLNPTSVSTSCLASLQQPLGILLLEQGLLHVLPGEEPPAKKMRGKTDLPPDVVRWIELAKLYRSIGDYDVLRGIFSGKIGTKQITQDALNAESKCDYAKAAKLYDQALSQNFLDGDPSDAEKDFWELASLECYNHLTEWAPLEYCSTVNIDNDKPPDLRKIWSDSFYQETYLPYLIRSKIKMLLHEANDQSLLTFIDDAMKVEQRKVLIETFYSQEMSLLYILQDDFDRAKYYISNGIQIFMQNYSSIDSLLHQSRLTKLQSVQALTEVQDFISFISKSGNLSSQSSLKRLFSTWTSRYPDDKIDPMNIWDDIITNRCFFLDKIRDKLPSQQVDDSMEIEDVGDGSGELDMDRKDDINSMIRQCKFTMKLKMVESARKQNNFSVAMKILKDLHRESKTREDWLVKWIHSYCRYSHSRSQSQSCSEQIQTVMRTISLLEESNTQYLNKNPRAWRYQDILLGTTYRIMADALCKEPQSLDQIGNLRAEKVIELSESPEEVAAGLYRKALRCLTSAVKKATEEEQSLSADSIDINGVVKSYMTLVDFCDAHLRKMNSTANKIDCKDFPEIVVEKMIKALKLNSKDARLKFPRLLQIIEQYPSETLDLMAKEVCSVPCWQFIGWINQMMAMLDKNESLAVQHIIEEIADNYPQAIVYAFMISGESYVFEDTVSGHKNREFVDRIKNKLDREGIVQDFIKALEQLSNPAMVLQDWFDDVSTEVFKSKQDKNTIKKICKELSANLWSQRGAFIGGFRRKFAEEYGKEFEKLCGKEGSKILDTKADAFSKTFRPFLDKIRNELKEPGNLKEYSPWMSEFKPEFLQNELEIPGQYDGKSKPMPEYHVKIAGFDERVKIQNSLRKPKRILIHGNDEKEYPFLVKGGEDLRQDQRIEQLFDIMNIILSHDAACSQRHMQLKTYQVIPMTTRIGLIEWLDNTCTMKDFIMNAMSEEERSKYLRDKGPNMHYVNWLDKKDKIAGPAQHISTYKNADRTATVRSFKERESLVPRDLLRRAFVKMSTTPEAFLALRSHFARSHALICISHWILGIGDRHLSNFMINTETGGMIGIDFGHAFGSATQFLPVPELMPFRLTRQIVNLMLPMKESGLFESVMVHALRAYRTHPDLLINTMDVFVKEPSLDWKNLEMKQMKKGGQWRKEVDTSSVNWYPVQKVNFAKRKLAGANPATITCEELRLGHEASPYFKGFISVARGDEEHNIRAKEPDDGLPEENQVQCLIDQATDPNILGRAWKGWEPWV